MGIMYSLAVESETVIKRMVNIFQEHVLKVGLDEIEKCADKVIKVSRLT